MKTAYRIGRAGLLALAAGLLLAACGQEPSPEQAQQGSAQERPPHPVEVAKLARQDLDLERSYPALLRSDDEVTLVARVTGTLEKRHFEPGQMVEKGDVLYSIEPDVYQAAVRQREADLQSARAQLERAQRDANRFERLLNQNSVSRQQVDQARSELSVARASVVQAEAALATARIDLDYAEVSAPVSGLISLSRVNVGNVVSSGTELATITPLDPLEVRFQFPQRDAFQLRRQMQEPEDAEKIRAVLQLPGLGSERLVGRLTFLGSRVEEGTSTVQASATFANPEHRVLPGQFVRVELEGLKRFDVLAVPEIAIGQGLMGPQVFVLDEDNVARARPIGLGEVAGSWNILRDGVEPGERVVVGDLAGIEPGVTIEPLPFDGDAQALVERSMQAGGQQQGAATAGGSAAQPGQEGQATQEAAAESESGPAEAGEDDA
ncbi:efflux RND transporter periplasmic adaptor subunit [Halomonas icarae]|uniref:Efflux RND transporter periplasmic adaptor subunit n=1 Tax=Halomonas icarae TaxID=2691040 RepID=A0A7X5AJH6_9GAMM|nr:efflux RND transporter periplasmic adaptor subunit [Halomonas icarae]MDR5901022.1 efflux RND transporter periplasmic adaptor subunit [Halomonas icarae]NAW11297.1 efflux RND transporter periplasmic adaptor subunit [Halomonas icarae]